MPLKFYLHRRCYWSTIEAWCLVGLHIGYTSFGLAFWPRGGPPKRRPWWVPHARLDLWAHTGQCDQRWVFRLTLGRRQLGYRTVGDATPDLWAYGNAGWYAH